jgi:hypothetical protein
MKKLLMAVFLCMLIPTVGFGSGLLPKNPPNNPTPVPTPIPTPVPTPTPAPTVTTEAGQKRVVSTETLWYFSKPIASYGTFDLYVSGKKYTIKGQYKGEFEMRDSETKKVAVVIAPPSYKDKEVHLTYPSGGTPTPPPTPSPTPGVIQTVWQKIIDHYNPWSFDGQGVSLIFCAGDKYKSVVINGVAMRLHEPNDEGRELWTTVDWRGKKPTNVRGLVVTTRRDGTIYEFYLDLPLNKNHWSDWKGECFRKGLE